jgi:NAD(P)-dependent dehydrogenase (short-subunit alcohol dehydrogenase family)
MAGAEMQLVTNTKVVGTSPLATLSGKNVVIIGGSRGLGRVILATMRAEGARVLAVARGLKSLAEVACNIEGSATLALDATEERAPAQVFELLDPDVLIMCAGAIPPIRPLHEQNWSEFSINWETDVKASFQFCKAALGVPLRPGAMVILISSGAAIGGSPISGGYAGAKRMQMFLANYCQKESDRLGLGLRFLAIAPVCTMPDTEVGKTAVNGYSRYLGMSAPEFIRSMRSRQTPQDVASAIVQFANRSDTQAGSTFMVSSRGVEPGP